MSWFTRKDKNIKDSKKKELPSDLWTKCNCGEILYSPELESANFICHHCSFHFPISSEKYINIILDDEMISISGKIQVFEGEFVTINLEASLSSGEAKFAINDEDWFIVSWD